MIPFDSLRERLMRKGLLGTDAGNYGAPDELMLISSGPLSHLSQFSVLCGPSRRRVIIRQPSRDILPIAHPHSPLSGETNLVQGAQFTFQRELWDGEKWASDTSTSSASLAVGLRDLCAGTVDRFSAETSERVPLHGPFWAGALSYDLCLLYTSPSPRD